ncbi:MAG: potassium channel family protein [Hyphomicrobiaceae bacterium]
MRETLRELYQGSSSRARAFRFGILAFDAVTIVFFVASSVVRDAAWIYVVDAIIAVAIIFDLAARYVVTERKSRFLAEATTWADFIVVITLLLPAFLESFLFLRVVRALRLLRSYRVLRDLRREFSYFRRNEETIQSAVNLAVFVFVMTALVYVLQVHHNPQIRNYIDALYFTVTALTTTGFGDITLKDTTGRILSVLIMVFGVALFLRLIQTIFRPTRVVYDCPDCGLHRHDADAVHCKHCGRVLNIATEGADF